MTQDEILEKKAFLKAQLTGGTGYADLYHTHTLWQLFYLYDNLFLGSYIRQTLSGPLLLCFSPRLKTSAGLTKFYAPAKGAPASCGRFEILISRTLLENLRAANRDVTVNGVPARDTVDALMLVFEHELCHVLEFLRFGKSSCKAPRFLEMAKGLFGHQGVTHQLPTRPELARAAFPFRPGDRVRFTRRGSPYQGVVASVGKQAAVMVPDPFGPYLGPQGVRYRKFYVPFSCLLFC